MSTSYDTVNIYKPVIKKNYAEHFLLQERRFPATLSIDTIFENHIIFKDSTHYHYYIFSFLDYIYIIPVHKEILKNSSSPFADIVSENEYFNDDGVFMYSHSSFFHEESSKYNICKDLFKPHFFAWAVSVIFYSMYINNSVLSSCFFNNKDNRSSCDEDLTKEERIIINAITEYEKSIEHFLNTHEYIYYFFRYFGETKYAYPFLGYVLSSYEITSDIINDYFGVSNGIIKDIAPSRFIELSSDNFELHLQEKKPDYYFNYNYIIDMFIYVPFQVSHHLLVNSSPMSNLEYPQYKKWMIIDGIYTLKIFPGNSIKFCGYKVFHDDLNRVINTLQFKEISFDNSLIEIGDQVFENNTFITKITLPDSLKRIGKEFCRGAHNLTGEIIIPVNVKKIGDSFLTTTSIDKITVLSEDLEIGYDFARISNIKTFTMISGKFKIGDYFLNFCESLIEVRIPDETYEISNHFMNESRKVIFNIPPKIKKIGNNFTNGNYVNLILPSSLVEIGFNFLRDCKTIKSIIIPETVITIGDSFMRESTVKEVIFRPGSNMLSIPKYFLSGTSKLEKVELPENIVYINEFFMSWSGIKKIKIPDNVDIINKNCFSDTHDLETVIFDTFADCTIEDNFAKKSSLKKIVYCDGSSYEIDRSLVKEDVEFVNLAKLD